jgi:hypothetical protein
VQIRGKKMKTEKLLIFMMVISFLLRVPLCLHPPEVLIPKVVSDDMFYYLCIARSIAGGLGATADGENATNGFHPFWALILVPVVGIFGDSPRALQMALLLLTLFSVLSAWFIYRIARFSCAEVPSLLAASVWLFCPYTLLIALAGVETPLYVLLFGATSYLYLVLCRDDSPAGANPGRWIALGFLAGATVLARIDGALLAAVIAVDMSFFRAGTAARGRPAKVLLFITACILVTLPWFFWSYARTGFLFPMSGKAIYHQQHVLFWAQKAGASPARYDQVWFPQVLSNICDAFRSVTFLCGLLPSTGIAVLLLCGGVLASAALAAPSLFKKWLGRITPLSFIFCNGLGIFLMYCAYLWYYQDWYYYSVLFVVLLLAACVLDLLDTWLMSRAPRPARTIAWAGVVLCVVFFSVNRTVALWNRGLRGWQIDMYRAALWVKENLPADSRIGSFNSGILAYYCPQRVINLDGVVNGAAYRAVVSGKIFSYIREQKIGYLIEAPLSLRFRGVQSPRAPLPLLKPIHVEAAYPEAVKRNNPVVVWQVVLESGGHQRELSGGGV